MSSGALLVLWNDAMRAKAIDWIKKAPQDTRVTFQGPKRTLPQNAMVHSLLTQISEQYRHHGQRLSVDDLKLVFLDSLKRELRIVPNLDNTGFVNLGRSTSKLSKAEMGDLITLIQAFAATHGIELKETA